MTPDQITDEDSLKAWLEGQTREVAVSIAHRAAMRVAPLYWRKVAPSADKLDLTALGTARPILISGVAGTSPTRAIKDSANGYADSFGTVVTATSNAVADAAAYVADAAVHVAAVDDDARAVAAAATTAATTAAARKYGEGAYGTGTYGGRKAVDEEDPAAIWEGVLQDTARLHGRETGQAAAAAPLWRDGQNPFDDDWQKVRTAWAATEDPGWRFWIEWYEAALAGRPLLGDWDRHWHLLTEIALIDPDKWDAGPDTVNPLIVKLLAKHEGGDPSDEVAAAIAKAEKSSSQRVDTVRWAMSANRSAIPQTCDALEALILLEIERLQKDNFLNATLPDECAQQVRNYLTMFEAVQALRARLPESGPVSKEAAAESEKLVSLYWKKLKALPRSKADDVVEGVWQTATGTVQGALILGSTGLAVSYGIPALAAFATGALVFAPNRASEILKAARETLPKF